MKNWKINDQMEQSGEFIGHMLFQPGAELKYIKWK
jgi:hypothetical protein